MVEHYQSLKDISRTISKQILFLLFAPHYYNNPFGKKLKKIML